MMKTKAALLFVLTCLLITGCQPKKQTEMILYNAKIYSVNESFQVAEAMAIDKGKIVAIGSFNKLTKKYDAKEKLDVGGKYIYPGFIDAHAHFYWFAKGLNDVNLRDTYSFDEIIEALQIHHKKTGGKYIKGFAWDNTKWENTEFPTKTLLDKHFPDIPVMLSRVDGHAMLVNSVVLKLADINGNTKVDGGAVILADGEPTGILVDNAMNLVRNLEIEKDTDVNWMNLFQLAQEKCFSVGLTGVSDLGLPLKTLKFFDTLYKTGSLKIRNYAMVDASPEGIEYMKNGEYLSNEELANRTLKIMIDGALGSRGAMLLEPYSDDPLNSGLVVTSPDLIRTYAQLAYDRGFQVCAHAIGDSANRIALQIFSEILPKDNDRRWRIEHAQVVDPADMKLFGEYNIIPSVQPTHATSDMDFADERLGQERIKNAYAYKELLDQNGWLPIGTDFPVERIDPLLSFYAAVARKDLNGNPKDGFQAENALSRQEALKGMTIWAAKSQFMENRIGSLEPGKLADFVILDADIMEMPIEKIPETKIRATYLQGERVFSVE